MGAAVQDIVYAFLQTYYQRMKKDPSKVSSLYSATAELTHINYQIDFDTSADVLPTIKLTGKENISKFFTRNNKKVSDLRAKIDSCDFQTASHSSILILTTGELFWPGTPAYRFCQTIVLQPNADNKNAYDVTNDVIRFIPDNWAPFSSNDSAIAHADESAVRAKSPAVNGKSITEVESPNSVDKTEKEHEVKSKKPVAKAKEQVETKESTPTNEPTRNETGDEIEKVPSEEQPTIKTEKPVATEPVETVVEAGEIKTAEKGESENIPAPVKEKQKELEAPAEAKGRPPARMSWASKLAASSDYIKPISPVASPSQTEASKADQQTSNNKKIAESKPEATNHKETTTTKPTKKKPQFSTVNKDGFYPIYIKGTAGVKEEKLKKVLENEFGTIMKMTTADSFAVVDFETQRSQMEALDRKQLMVGDTEVCLSRKTVKKSTGSPPVGSSNSARSHKKHSNKKRD